jgi:hypothetical protein
VSYPRYLRILILTHLSGISADTLYLCYCIDKETGDRRRTEVFELVRPLTSIHFSHHGLRLPLHSSSTTHVLSSSNHRGSSDNNNRPPECIARRHRKRLRRTHRNRSPSAWRESRLQNRRRSLAQLTFVSISKLGSVSIIRLCLYTHSNRWHRLCGDRKAVNWIHSCPI